MPQLLQSVLLVPYRPCGVVDIGLLVVAISDTHVSPGADLLLGEVVLLSVVAGLEITVVLDVSLYACSNLLAEGDGLGIALGLRHDLGEILGGLSGGGSILAGDPDGLCLGKVAVGLVVDVLLIDVSGGRNDLARITRAGLGDKAELEEGLVILVDLGEGLSLGDDVVYLALVVVGRPARRWA